MSTWFNKLKNVLVTVCVGYLTMTLWCAIISLGITAILVVPTMILFGRLPGWVLWADIALIVAVVICWRKYKNRPSRSERADTPIALAKRALDAAADAKVEAESAKADALAATTKDVANAAAKKAEKASLKAAQAARTAKSIANAVDASDSHKVAIDTIAQDAVNEANEASMAFLAADTAAKRIAANPYAKINSAMNDVTNAESEAEAAKLEVIAAPDRTTAYNSVAKADQALNKALQAQADANSVKSANPTNGSFVTIASIIDRRVISITSLVNDAHAIASAKP